MAEKCFVVLDRDGTIIEEKFYLSDPDKVALVPGAAQGLRKMQDMGLGLIVVTNQSGIARGYLDEARLEQIHDRMKRLLSDEGVRLDRVYYCPHLPEEDCSCRKPKPGLIHRAAQDYGFEEKKAFVIGDKHCDIDLGRAVGATTILVRSGYGAELESDENMRPDHVVDDLVSAAEIIYSVLLKRKTEASL